ncbi:ribosome biogenesis GTP-binding protein YihA/YsxC [Halosquirtibacter xylanolyticus]|uniref:ribosome biogenesis GTP-binding protein YihA/YsxC n=1 Tax=Halosquirtibacter xylanolyticus TaxID=3374599 RepID=UPI003747F4E4|nr:ribosome biogenesis GTP-binding protein YihA/YsxC [Prolixibacteraceae bacterium]
MQIKTAKFVISNTDPLKCPKSSKPEYAFVGRSNVGKSSLINMLTNQKKLAKTSGRPGKTQLINHFIINDYWYLVDLPGYGYAQVSRTQRRKWQDFVRNYIQHRDNLTCVMVLVDSRHEPQQPDLEFIEWLGINGVPFAIIFTKADKLSKNQLAKSIAHYKSELLKTWEELPPHFITSAESGDGAEGLLGYIDQINESLKKRN